MDKQAMYGAVFVFDRDLVRRHRDRAAEHFTAYDFLFREVGTRLLERLEDIRCHFPVVLELGCRTGTLARILTEKCVGVEYLIRSDLSEAMAHRAVARTCTDWLGSLTVVADEEYLPFRKGGFDLVISNLTLHWVNDLPGTLIQARQLLKPGGFFIASLIGGYSLSELRIALAYAEGAVESGQSSRISPLVDIYDAGILLQRAGFDLPVADLDTIVVSYANPLQLLLDLRGMGETNAMLSCYRSPLHRSTLKRALDRYHAVHINADGRVPATFQILYLTGRQT